MIVETYKLTVNLVEYLNSNEVCILKAIKICAFEQKKLEKCRQKNFA